MKKRELLCRIEALEARVRELESRPVMPPVWPWVVPQLPSVPPLPWEPQVIETRPIWGDPIIETHRTIC